jgi:beta-lactamase class A
MLNQLNKWLLFISFWPIITTATAETTACFRKVNTPSPDVRKNLPMNQQDKDSILDTTELGKRIQKEIAKHQKAGFAIAFKDLQTDEMFFLNEKVSFHAASTMKTPVMAEVFRQASEGQFSLDDSVTVYNTFSSIADGTKFSVQPSEDSEQDLYTKLGSKVTIMDLLLRMITRSSNLATNILIDKVGAKNVNNTMRSIGAKDIQILRGVEDGKAYDKAMNNTVTAFDLLLLFEQIANNSMVNKEASQGMLNILMRQQLKGAISARLPKSVRVANKTGSITGILNDSAIIFLPGGRRYVLVLLSSGMEPAAAMSALSEISLLIYQHVIAN